MRDREPTARSRELGAELRRLREHDGRSSIAIADELGWSASRISRLESGKRGVSEIDLAILLAAYGVRGAELDRLLTMDRRPYERSWLRSNHEQRPDELRIPIVHETMAQAITEYEPLLIPRLLQTEDYAQAMLTAAKLVPDHIVDLRLHAQRNRQAILERKHPPRLTFFITEQALRTPVGDASVLHDQLQYLLIMSRHPACVLRILPATKASAGLFGLPFRLLEYKDFQPVVHFQNQAATAFLEEPEDVNTYRAILGRVGELSLDEAQSAHALDELVNASEQPGLRVAPLAEADQHRPTPASTSDQSSWSSHAVNGRQPRL